MYHMSCMFAEGVETLAFKKCPISTHLLQVSISSIVIFMRTSSVPALTHPTLGRLRYAWCDVWAGRGWARLGLPGKGHRDQEAVDCERQAALVTAARSRARNGGSFSRGNWRWIFPNREIHGEGEWDCIQWCSIEWVLLIFFFNRNSGVTWRSLPAAGQLGACKKKAWTFGRGHETVSRTASV